MKNQPPLETLVTRAKSCDMHLSRQRPFSTEELIERCHAICGCAGRHPFCDCVSVLNKARSELWSEANAH